MSNIDLQLGDCLKLMKDIPDKSVDVVITDPPYGIDYQSQWKKDKSTWMPKIKNDKKPFVEFIPELKRILKDSGCALVFTRFDVQQQFIDKFLESGLPVKNVLIWDKQIHGMGDLKRSYGSRYESIIFTNNYDFRFPGKRPQDIISCRRVLPKDLLHPNEKPIELIETIINQVSYDNTVILDPFMGSGSTGVACINTNRNFIGMELEQKYFDIATKRIFEAQRTKGEIS